MDVLVTGLCGFVGATLARAIVEAGLPWRLAGCDNFVRPGSESNRVALRQLGVRVLHADLRLASDVDALPRADIVIDAAASPSVLAGVDGRMSSRQLVEHNLVGTMNLLEYCRRHRATLLLLSTSRVYSIPPLAALPVEARDGAFVLDAAGPLPPGVSAHGIDESFSTAPPVSVYGSTKVAAEQLALEYGDAYGFPVWIDRCGVMAGPGQFGRADQGIFSYWITAWLHRRPLCYLGFGGSGHQVRDCLDPADLLPLLVRQVEAGTTSNPPRIVNASGGLASAMSLRQLSDWCRHRFGDRAVEADGTERPFDLPWAVLDPRLARRTWDWAPRTPTSAILERIARHAEAHPDWPLMSESI
jgi:CDP-paratose 2-epimerase